MNHRLTMTRDEKPVDTSTTAAPKLRGKPFAKGPDPRRGVSPGRPTDAFTEMMRSLASADETMKALTKILKNGNHPMFMRALEYVTDRGYGKATQPIDVTSDGKSLADVLREGRDRVARMRNAPTPDGVQ